MEGSSVTQGGTGLQAHLTLALEGVLCPSVLRLCTRRTLHATPVKAVHTTDTTSGLLDERQARACMRRTCTQEGRPARGQPAQRGLTISVSEAQMAVGSWVNMAADVGLLSVKASSSPLEPRGAIAPYSFRSASHIRHVSGVGAAYTNIKAAPNWPGHSWLRRMYPSHILTCRQLSERSTHVLRRVV